MPLYPQILLSPTLCSAHLDPVPSGFMLTQIFLALASMPGISPAGVWRHSPLLAGSALSWPCYGRTLAQWPGLEVGLGPERGMCYLEGWRPVHCLQATGSVDTSSGPGYSRDSGNSRCSSVNVTLQSLRVPFFPFGTLDI